MILESPQRKGRRYINPWPGIPQHGLCDVARWMIGRRGKRGISAKEVMSLERTAPSFEVPRAPPDVLTATWIGHTTVLLQIGGLNILTDPIWNVRASPLSFAGPRRFTAPGVAFDSLPVIDGILLSHNHYDHLDSATVDRLTARFPALAWRVPLGVGAFLRSHGAMDVEELGWGDATAIEGVRLTCVPAQHFSGRTPFDRDRSLWCGWALRAGNRSVYFAGDSALNPSFTSIGESCGPFDLALMPIGAYDPRWFMRAVHMDPEECITAVRMLAPEEADVPCLLATHWGTFKLTGEPLDEPPRRMREAWTAAGLPPEKLWIPAFGETRHV